MRTNRDDFIYVLYSEETSIICGPGPGPGPLKEFTAVIGKFF